MLCDPMAVEVAPPFTVEQLRVAEDYLADGRVQPDAYDSRLWMVDGVRVWHDYDELLDELTTVICERHPGPGIVGCSEGAVALLLLVHIEYAGYIDRFNRMVSNSV